MDAFQILGIERRLVVSDERLREAFREAGKQVHPDAVSYTHLTLPTIYSV